MNVTVFDLGSNSFQLLQARRTDAGRIEPLFSAVEFVQLARFVDAQHQITPDGFVQGVQAVKRLLAQAPASAVDGPVVAVATCAIRDASNGSEFLARVHAETGLKTTIVSTTQEASLTYTGAISEFAPSDEAFAVVDLGGGSTQIAWGRGMLCERQVGIPLGVLALAERLAGLPNIGNAALDQMATFVRRTIEPAVIKHQPQHPGRLVFASGVARVILSLVYSYGLVSRGTVVPSHVLADLVPRLLDASERELMERGVPEKRLHSVGPTAVVLGVITDLFELERFTVARGGLREGIALTAEQVGMQAWPRVV